MLESTVSTNLSQSALCGHEESVKSFFHITLWVAQNPDEIFVICDPWCSHSGDSPIPECGHDLGLASGQQNMARAMGFSDII